MKKLDVYNYKGKTDADDEVIMTCILKKIDMKRDEFNRVFSEAGQYIADVILDMGNGTGTREFGISELLTLNDFLAESEEEYKLIEEHPLVERFQNLGYSSTHEGYYWVDVELADGTQINIYINQSIFT